MWLTKRSLERNVTLSRDMKMSSKNDSEQFRKYIGHVYVN